MSTSSTTPLDYLRMLDRGEQPSPFKKKVGPSKKADSPKKTIIKKPAKKQRAPTKERVVDTGGDGDTVIERASETTPPGVGRLQLRPLENILEDWGATDIDYERRVQPDEIDAGVRDTVTFDYERERFIVYCYFDKYADEVRLFIDHRQQRSLGQTEYLRSLKDVLIGESNVTRSRFPAEDCGTMMEIGGSSQAIEIYDELYRGRGMCKLMVLINLYYSLARLSLSGAPAPSEITVHISSHYPLSAYYCYKRAAKAVGYSDGPDDMDQPEAREYQERVAQHSDRLGLRASFDEGEFSQHFSFTKDLPPPSEDDDDI